MVTAGKGAYAAGCPCVSASPVVEAGMPAPDLHWTRAYGITACLADLRGAPVILTFLGVSWDPARAEFQSRYDDVLRDLKAGHEIGAEVTRIDFEGANCRIGFNDRTEISASVLAECDLDDDAANRYGVSGRRAVFVIDGEGMVRWRYVAAAGTYPQPDAVRAALRASLADTPEKSDRVASSSAVPAFAITRRDFVGAALAAAVAVALLPLGQSRAQDTAGTSATTAPPLGTVPVTLMVNGITHKLNLDPRVTLLDALREYIGLTGSKKGCDHGQCGACTLHIEGRRVNSCLTLAVAAQNKPILTIEGLAQGDTLHPVQMAFLKHDGFQCGYCTPGQIMSAVALLKEGHAHTRDDVRELMSGNLCRCGAYPNIVDAVEEVRTHVPV